jgi:prepilin-type N-terminal cleavage/methylation domain-containing protein
MRTKDTAAGWRQGGFTLVELMVALALAAMISVSIMFISSQARLSYEATVKKIDVYNRFRFVLHAIDKDIKNWIPTSDLEFYADGRGGGSRRNDHWDPGEELPDRKDGLGPGVVDGGRVGEYDEFAHIIERHYYSEDGGARKERKLHDAYQVYFRTLTHIDGGVRLANVEFLLLDPKYAENNSDEEGTGLRPPREVKRENVKDLALFKVVRYHDIDFKTLNNVNEITIKRHMQELSTNVTDFRVEYMVDKDFRARQSPGFRTPSEDYENPVELATRPQRSRERPYTYRKSFGYGSVKLDENVERATAFPATQGDDNLAPGGGRGEHIPMRFGFRGNSNIFFAELIPGDRIFIFTEASRGETPGGGAGLGVGGSGTEFVRFPSKDYTVKTNLQGLLELEEDFDTVTWGGQPQRDILYKAAFLPSAVRITLRIVDDKGENPKTLQREIWLRRRSR